MFHRCGHQVARHYQAGTTACGEPGDPGRLLHDMLRSAVWILIMAAVDESAAMTATGHETRSVFDRYPIVSGSDVAVAMAKVSARMKPLESPALAAQL